jgi:hypothetical protein
MFPEMVAQANLKWSPRICLTSTPAAPPIMPIGQPGLLKSQEKMLLFLQLTRCLSNQKLQKLVYKHF